MDLKYEHKYKKYKNKYNDLKGGGLYETINEFFNYPFYLTNESVAKIIDTINKQKSNIQKINRLIYEKITYLDKGKVTSIITDDDRRSAINERMAASAIPEKGQKHLKRNLPASLPDITIFGTDADKKQILSDANVLFTKYNYINDNNVMLTFYLYTTYITGVLSTLYTHINYIQNNETFLSMESKESEESKIKTLLFNCDEYIDMLPYESTQSPLKEILQKVYDDYKKKINEINKIMKFLN